MKQAVLREDDDTFLGYVDQDSTSWQAQTIFGYIIARTETKKAAEEILHKRGLHYLKGVWQYYDKDEHDWFACTIKDANKTIVTIIRTNDMGYQEPDLFKVMSIKNPDENSLIKSS